MVYRFLTFPLFIAVTILCTIEAKAYTNFIGHSYTSCLNCHYNPTGGGPLTDYGRAVSATAISSKMLYPDSWSEERVAYASGFLFRKPKQKWLRTQINYRGFQVVRNPGSERTEEKQWINMQLDARLILKFGQNDKFVAVGNYGYAPLPEGVEEQTEWRSREHYVGYRFTPKFGVYAGLMDKAYGIKVLEHIAFSRSAPQVAQNDQVHGVMGHFLGEKWEITGQGFAGNLGQEAELQMKGGSLMVERTSFDIHRLGFSAMKSKNEFLDLTSYAVHGRFNLKEGSAVLAEIGETTKTTFNKTDDRTMRYGLLQTYLRPFRGVYFLSNIEYFNKDVEQDDYTVRWGPGLQFFPVQRVELRFDAYNTRNFSTSSSTKDSWMYLLQAHLWL
ncbi:MAG TPA: hypothetical protein VNJ01_06195 [Bacteriovoracaceae bacterium]|nr:hypothetical protein [Bacteriovoracaceae bacterium]